MNTIEWSLAERARRCPDADAVIHIRAGQATEHVTVADLNGRADAFCELVRSRLEPGRLVLLYMNRSADTVAAIVGTARAGGVFAPANRRLRPAQVLDLARRARASLIVCDEPSARQLAQCSFDGVEAVTLAASSRGDSPAIAEVNGRRMEAWSLSCSVRREAGGHHRLRPDLSACCLFTSGSTGTPKGVLMSAPDLDARAAAEVELFDLTSADRLLGILPFSFDVGLNQLLTALLTGAPLVLTDSWLPADVIQATRQHGISGISAVPAIWRDILKTPFGGDSLGADARLRYITVSGGSLSPPELIELQNRFPAVGVFLTYGQTETFRSSALRPTELRTRLGSVGRAFGGARVRILDESGRECAPNVVGEVVHAGLGVMIGYLDGQDPTRKLRSNPWVAEDAYPTAVWTGDHGYLDDEGYLFLKGREDGMLKVAGHRFYPAEVSGVVLASPDVAEAEVVGVGRTDGDTEVVVYIVPKGQVDGVAKTVTDMLRLALPSYMVPTRVVVVPAIPRLGNGKPDLQHLRRNALAAC